jgi:putative acetyltransferase
MISCIHTNSENKDFRQLVEELDKDLSIRDGADHLYYSQFNKIDKIKYVIIAFDQNTPVGCGAIKEYSGQIMEVKRMFVPLKRRGEGIASVILHELEKWAFELGYTMCRLETGKKQPEAIRLYQKNGYGVIPNFGQYENMENSVCFEKSLAYLKIPEI